MLKTLVYHANWHICGLKGLLLSQVTFSRRGLKTLIRGRHRNSAGQSGPGCSPVGAKSEELSNGSVEIKKTRKGSGIG